MSPNATGLHAPQPGLLAPYWMREATRAGFATESALPPPHIAGTDWDVAIVGGGFTGMWAAWHLLERDRATRVLILERDRCGAGASGRNGGFVHGWWDTIDTLVEMFGDDAALRMARELDASVDGIGAWCAAQGVDAWYRQAGYLQVSATPAHDESWAGVLATARRLGAADSYVPVSAEEVHQRCASPAFRAGVLMPNGATIQPARLAFALRRELEQRGACIAEGTAVTGIKATGTGVNLTTNHGPLTTSRVIVAMNAWAGALPWFRSRLLSWGSYIVLTEPIPDRLAALNWTGGEGIADGRFTVRYLRTTPDGRIAFGAGVGQAGYGGRIGRSFTDDPTAASRVADGFRRFFPDLADVQLEEAWGGPIDVSSDRLPVVGSLSSGRIWYAHGYSGNGVAPSHLAGRILADAISGPGELTSLPIVHHRQRRFPPEPFRFLGARAIREALIRSDDAEEAGRRPALAWRTLASVPRLMGYRLGHARPTR